MNKISGRGLPAGSAGIAVLFVLVMLSAIMVAYSANDYRQQVNALFEEMKQREKLQAQWGRLVLEHSTWTAHNRIETIAGERLNMLVPEPAAVRVVTP